MNLVQVFIEHANPTLNKPYSYYTNDKIVPFVRVEVLFNHRYIIGFVCEVSITDKHLEEIEQELGYKLTPIHRLIDEEPLLNEELMELAQTMSYRTVSPLISCLNTILPPNLKAKKTKQMLVYETWIKRIANSDVLTPKRKAALDSLNQPMRYSDFNKEHQGMGLVLEKLGLTTTYKVLKTSQLDFDNKMKADLKFTSDQQNAFDMIQQATEATILLHGITGSGKTELYLQLARQMILEQKQVLILVPEIALTPQMVKRVVERFQNKVAIYHSALSTHEKYLQYQLVKCNKVSVVVGTRSSVFMPFTNLGLIIIDEEHDSSYKQDSTPCYHVRDIAFLRQKKHHCKILLGSATPSLESYARAIKGVYKLVNLHHRVNQTLPSIEVVDLNQVIRKNEDYIISPKLKNEIVDRLNKREQVILLLNRRGYSPIIKCSNCNEVLNCIHCDIALSYHKDEGKMRCHMCDYFVNSFICPKCQHTMSTNFGFGVQKVEELLKNWFPEAAIERMDRDTTRIKNGHQQILDRFERHEIDILIGTQMIAKGLDFPLVTLVAVINADSGLNRLDYKSQEVVFDLMMQAAGRSGRHVAKGHVILQVHNPNHFVVKATLKQDYTTFFSHEMRYRHQGKYPPYTYLVAIYVSHINQEVCFRAMKIIEKMLEDVPFKVLGPTSLGKIKTLTRYRFILKGNNLETLIAKANEISVNYHQQKCYAKMKVDVEPQYLE